jgi:transposase InsO family protein
MNRDQSQIDNPQSAIRDLPTLPACKVTEAVQKKIEGMLKSIAAEEVASIEEEVERTYGIARKTQGKYKFRIRKLFDLPQRAPIQHLVFHPQIRQILESLLIRPDRSDKGTLRSAKNVAVLKADGEKLSLEEHLLAVYAWENHNAAAAYRSLIPLCHQGAIVFEHSGVKCTMHDMPAEGTVVHWLRTEEKKKLALRRARMTKGNWEAKEMIYIARRPEQYRPGGVLIGDHTELDNLVYRLDGPIGTITTGHLWVTMFIDYRCSLPKGWVLSRQPNSQTIALAFRNAVLGTQLRIATHEGWMAIPINDAPEDVLVDRGKDFKSQYTQQVIGHLDFDDEGQRCVQRVSHLRYVTKHHPQSKAQQERFFRTIQQITRYLPGYKGSKYQDKPDELKGQIDRWELMTEEEFTKAFDEAVWAYSNRPRRALNDMSPMEFYLQHQQYVRRVEERVLDFLMLKSEERKVHRGYVVIENVEYFSMDLEGCTGKSAVIYRDPQDLGRAVVYVDGEFVTVAINKEMMGVTEQERLKWVRARTEREKIMTSEIRGLRQGMSSRDVKRLLFQGETGNVKRLELEVIKKQIDQRLIETGLEQKAGRVADEIHESTRRAEKTARRKRISEQHPITVAAIEKIQ